MLTLIEEPFSCTKIVVGATKVQLSLKSSLFSALYPNNSRNPCPIAGIRSGLGGGNAHPYSLMLN